MRFIGERTRGLSERGHEVYRRGDMTFIGERT